LIPGWLISGLIGEREGRQAEMAHEFAASWGAEQILGSPLLIVPYQIGSDGVRQYLRIAADTLEVDARLAPEDRHRGLFHASVYGATVQMRGSLRIPSLATALPDHARLLWQESFLLLGLSGRSGMKEGDRVVWNGQNTAFQNCQEILVAASECASGGGILLARIPDSGAPQPETDIPFQLTVDLRGTSSFTVTSSARQLTLSAEAPWPTPSFGDTLLPVTSQVSREGFEARWQAVDYGAARIWTTPHIDAGPAVNTVKIELLDAVPIYRMINRAAKYHALFLGLSFATYLLFEVLSGIRIHLIQYGLMALSLSLFALLLLSLAEPLGYDAGFLGSSSLVLVQASLYTASVTRRLREAGLFAAMLAILFGFLYVLLSLETYSLLVGSLALFLLLSVLMALTSRIDWSKWSSGSETP
jgi:inner membrane protein